MTTTTEPLREVHRRELATLLERDPLALTDETPLREELGLDSLAMMSLVTWLESRGAVVDLEQNKPERVGEVLSLLERRPLPLKVRVTSNGEVIGPPEAPADPFAITDPLVPQLVDTSVRLVAVTPDDVAFLYDLTVRPENCFRWRYRGAPPSFDRFHDDLWKTVLAQFVVRRRAGNQPLGQVVAYGASPSLQYAYVGAIFQPQIAGTGLAAHSVSLFVRYLFHTFPMKKLYLEVPGFNWDQMSSGEGRLFTVEGVLRDHNFYAGRYWDEYICAIYRDGNA